MREQTLRRLIREEIQRLNESKYYPDEQFGGKGSPFAGSLLHLIIQASHMGNKDYEVTVQMSGGMYDEPLVIPNSKDIRKIEYDNPKVYWDWEKGLERKVKQKFRKDSLKMRKEIEKIILDEFEKLKSKIPN